MELFAISVPSELPNDEACENSSTSLLGAHYEEAERVRLEAYPLLSASRDLTVYYNGHPNFYSIQFWASFS
jgi:hypothetical protein